MKIAKFEATGLLEVADALGKFPAVGLGEYDIRQLLKITNISFVLEEINRLQSMLICELKDSYVQQSQRYVRLDESGYTLPKLSRSDAKEADELIGELFSLYERMAERKAGDYKGRPQKEQYVHGIPIEDARYILPLAVKTNVYVAMSGDKLVDFYILCRDLRYQKLLMSVWEELERYLPPILSKALQSLQKHPQNAKLQELFYRQYFDRVSDTENMVLLAKFDDLDSKAALGALTSTHAIPPSELSYSWSATAKNPAAEITKRVMGYGHTSIAEQARVTVGMMCSLVTYHQQLRHRLTSNVREDLESLLEAVERPVKCPPSIAGSEFAAEYLQLAEKVREFRRKIGAKHGKQAALYFLLNCEQIKLLLGANARADAAMLSDRTCMNAQWEIRELAVKKVKLLRGLSKVLYENALPSCVKSVCREGKMSCGKASEVRAVFEQITDDEAGENG